MMTLTTKIKQKFSMASLYTVLFIDALGIGILMPLLARVLIRPNSHVLVQHASIPERSLLYGIILGAYFLAWFFGAAILGELSDSAGRKKALLICMMGVAISYFLTALSFVFHSITLMIVGRLVAGLTAGSQPIAQAAITDVSPPEKLTRNLGFTLLAFTSGMAAGPVIGSFLSESSLVSWFSITTPLYLIIILALINYLLIVYAFNETVSRPKKIHLHWGQAITIFTSAFQHKSIRPLTIAFTLILIGYNGYYIYISIFLLHRFNFSITDIGLYMALLGLGLAIGNGVLPSLLSKRHYSDKMVVLVSYSIFILGILLITYLHSSLLAWLLVLPINAAFSLAYVFILSLLSRQVGPLQQGWVMGINGAMVAFAAGSSTIMSSLIAFSGISSPLYFDVVVAIIGIFLFVCFRSQPYSDE